MVWRYLLVGRLGSVQCKPVEGTNTSTDLPTLLDGEPPDIISPKYNKAIIMNCPNMKVWGVGKELGGAEKHQSKVKAAIGRFPLKTTQLKSKWLTQS